MLFSGYHNYRGTFWTPLCVCFLCLDLDHQQNTQVPVESLQPIVARVQHVGKCGLHTKTKDGDVASLDFQKQCKAAVQQWPQLTPADNTPSAWTIKPSRYVQVGVHGTVASRAPTSTRVVPVAVCFHFTCITVMTLYHQQCQ